MRHVLLLGTLCVAGCATMPITGAPATGEHLSIEESDQLRSYTAKVKVGEVNYTTSSGQSAGKADIYQNQTQYYTVHKWHLAQGGNRIDDYDFFKIAGDLQAASEIESYRQTGITMNNTGLGVLIAGAVATLAGGFMAATPNARVPGSVIGGTGLVTGLIGYFVWAAGARRLDPETHPLDAGRAQVALARYNAAINGSAGLAPPPPPPPAANVPPPPAYRPVYGRDAPTQRDTAQRR